MLIIIRVRLFDRNRRVTVVAIVRNNAVRAAIVCVYVVIRFQSYYYWVSVRGVVSIFHDVNTRDENDYTVPRVVGVRAYCA